MLSNEEREKLERRLDKLLLWKARARCGVGYVNPLETGVRGCFHDHDSEIEYIFDVLKRDEKERENTMSVS